MQFQVITSTADGNQTKEFSNWEDAHLYANEWMDGFTHWNHRHFNNIETTEYVNLWKTRNGETVRIEEIENDDNDLMCDGCVNQESIAAPGEITKCRQHQEKSDDEHYAEMRKFFNENLRDLEFNSYLPYCSQCGKKNPVYVGMMRAFKRDFPLTFAFCIDCHDDLVRRADAAKQSPERFGV